MESLILIHTGHHLPPYLKDCVKQAQSQGIVVHLILSDELFSFFDCPGALISPESKYCSFDYLNYHLACNVANFRDNFLHRASSRFFLLQSYAERNGLENFYHMENDILLYHPLTHVSKVLAASEYNSCVVMDAPNRGVSSLMWFRNVGAVNSFCDVLKSNVMEDDMRNIAKFFHTTKGVTNFPILAPSCLPWMLKDGEPNFKCDNLFVELGYVFDGAAIGQFIGGIDPQNQMGNLVGFVNETTVFDSSKADYEFASGKPYMVLNGIKIPIFNLHIHCKNLKRFSSYA